MITCVAIALAERVTGIDSMNHSSRFTNRYGEEWIFEYDPATSEGILKGSDVGWQSYRVVNGHAIDLILSDEELVWLRKVWTDATAFERLQ
jgi:hypothetical protein